MTAKSVARGPAGDPNGAIGRQPPYHRVQREVLVLIEEPDKEGVVGVEGGQLPAALPPRRQFADPRPCDPADRTRKVNPELLISCQKLLQLKKFKPMLGQLPRNDPLLDLVRALDYL